MANETYLTIFFALSTFILAFIFQIFWWRVARPKNTFLLIFFIYLFFGILLLLFLKESEYKNSLNIESLLLYFLLVGAFINTYPAIESNIVTFRIQECIKRGPASIEDIEGCFTYEAEIYCGIEQLVASNLATYNDEQNVALSSKGVVLAKIFIIFGSILKLKVGG